MSENMKERYTTYPKKKEKKQARLKEGDFLRGSFEWLKWKLIHTGNLSFHKPCLEH
jgi:hypothetical protein